MTDNSRAAVAHNAHVHLNGRNVLLPSNLVESLEFKFRMRATANDGDVLRPTDIGQSFRDISWIVVAAAGNQNANRRVPRLVRITIGGHVLSSPARRID